MSLFKKKIKTEKPACSCGCGCGDTKAESNETTCTCCGETADAICCIKVLGAGCKNCHTFYENTKEAVKSLGLDIEVEYITDMEKVMEYGVMTMPVLVVNEKVAAAGKVLKPKEIEVLLK